MSTPKVNWEERAALVKKNLARLRAEVAKLERAVSTGGAVFDAEINKLQRRIHRLYAQRNKAIETPQKELTHKRYLLRVAEKKGSRVLRLAGDMSNISEVTRELYRKD